MMGSMERVPSGKDILFKDLKVFLFFFNLTGSKKIKCKRKKLVSKYAIESGNKWDYGAQWGLVDLGKDFCLYLKEVESHWRILSKGVTEVHFRKIMRGAAWRENYRTKSASKETQKMVIEVFQERDGGGRQQGCWRRWRDVGKGKA